MLIKRGEELADHSLTLGAQGDRHTTLVIAVGRSLDQLLILQSLDHAGQSAFRDTGFLGHVTCLLGSPYPQHPQNSEGNPTEVVVGEYRALHVISHGSTGAVDVRDGAHGDEVELSVLEAVAYICLGLQDFFRGGRRDAATHDQ